MSTAVVVATTTDSAVTSAINSAETSVDIRYVFHDKHQLQTSDVYYSAKR